MCSVTAAIAGVGLAMSAASSVSQASQAQSQAKFQSEVNMNEAKSEEMALSLRRQDRQRELNRELARQRVVFGAQGTSVDPSISAITAAEYARDDYMDVFNTNRRINSYLNNATSATLTGRNRAQNSLFDFGSTAFQLGSKLFAED